jgi:hypothetical protein
MIMVPPIPVPHIPSRHMTAEDDLLLSYISKSSYALYGYMLIPVPHIPWFLFYCNRYILQYPDRRPEKI